MRRQTRSAAQQKRRRRSIQAIVTEEAIEDIQGLLATLFRAVERDVPPPETEAEAQRRAKALRDGYCRAVFGCLAYLRARDHHACELIVNAGLQYAEDLVRGEPEGRWQLRREKKPPMWWLTFAPVLQMHETFTSRLRENWNTPPRPLQLQKPHGRMGESQRRGLARTAAARAGRRDTVVQIFRELVESGANPTVVPNDSQVDRLVRHSKTPAELSKKILAYALGRTPRQVEALLNDARKKNAANLASLRARDAWEQREQRSHKECVVILEPSPL